MLHLTAAELNILDGVTSTAAELNILDGVTSTATELNLLDGSSANSVVNSKAVIYGSSGQLAGTLSTAAQTNITSLGTLSALTVDDITINGSTISDGGDFVLDVGGNITLDADGGNIRIKDGGTEYGTINKNSTANLSIYSAASDADLLLQGNDGGSVITALTLDMSAAGAATFNNNVTAFSDRRLKSDIQTIENGLEKVEQLRGVTYTRDDNVDGGQQLGVIAQEVEEVFPQVVLTADDERGTKSVDYGRLTGALIEAVKELSAKVKELEGKLDGSTK